MKLKVAVAQIAPVWLNRDATTEKIIECIRQAGGMGCELIALGETILPGYPFWIQYTDGARFNSKIQKEMHAHYLKQAVSIPDDLRSICEACDDFNIAATFGVVERANDRGGHSVYCTAVFIDANGKIKSTHRKLMPTYEERLCWAAGDGQGLVVHPLKSFAVGVLNCWENWMPLSRAALYAQGENLHVALWPGEVRNTVDITKFIALESRSYVISVSGILKKDDIPDNTPHYHLLMEKFPENIANGGSCIASPTGEWLVEPLANKEDLIVTELDYNIILEERQNFDVAGHYSRPDVTRLIVNRERQSLAKFED